MKAMERPRCGNKDVIETYLAGRQKRYALSGEHILILIEVASYRIKFDILDALYYFISEGNFMSTLI